MLFGYFYLQQYIGGEAHKMSKRVLSPFITIYSPQITSMFSILERISGIFLMVIGFIWIMLIKLETIFFTYYSFYLLDYNILVGNNVLLNSIILFILLNFFYHLVFGCRYVYWNMFAGESSFDIFNIEISKIYKSTYFLLSIVVILTIIFFLILVA